MAAVARQTVGHPVSVLLNKRQIDLSSPKRPWCKCHLKKIYWEDLEEVQLRLQLVLLIPINNKITLRTLVDRHKLPQHQKKTMDGTLLEDQNSNSRLQMIRLPPLNHHHHHNNNKGLQIFHHKDNRVTPLLHLNNNKRCHSNNRALPILIKRHHNQMPVPSNRHHHSSNRASPTLINQRNNHMICLPAPNNHHHSSNKASPILIKQHHNQMTCLLGTMPPRSVDSNKISHHHHNSNLEILQQTLVNSKLNNICRLNNHQTCP